MKLKYIKHLALGIALALALSATAFASPEIGRAHV